MNGIIYVGHEQDEKKIIPKKSLSSFCFTHRIRLCVLKEVGGEDLDHHHLYGTRVTISTPLFNKTLFLKDTVNIMMMMII